MRAAFFVSLFAATVAAQPHENLNAVVWMQTSAEYQALTRQAYRSAAASLTRALADPTWTAALEQIDSASEYGRRAPAVILDLDETVLDNSMFQARLTARGGTFSQEQWQKWVAEKRAGMVPGAREFLMLAHGRGVNIFYVTNRTCDPSKEDDPTVAVVKAHALPFHPGRLLCRTDTGDKSPRRRAVSLSHRILLLIGDDLNDFVTTPFDLRQRSEFVADLGHYWGERWFLLPNPTYGSWERSAGNTVDAKRKLLRQ